CLVTELTYSPGDVGANVIALYDIELAATVLTIDGDASRFAAVVSRNDVPGPDCRSANGIEITGNAYSAPPVIPCGWKRKDSSRPACVHADHVACRLVLVPVQLDPRLGVPRDHIACPGTGGRRQPADRGVAPSVDADPVTQS